MPIYWCRKLLTRATQINLKSSSDRAQLQRYKALWVPKAEAGGVISPQRGIRVTESSLPCWWLHDCTISPTHQMDTKIGEFYCICIFQFLKSSKIVLNFTQYKTLERPILTHTFLLPCSHTTLATLAFLLPPIQPPESGIRQVVTQSKQNI